MRSTYLLSNATSKSTIVENYSIHIRDKGSEYLIENGLPDSKVEVRSCMKPGLLARRQSLRMNFVLSHKQSQLYSLITSQKIVIFLELRSSPFPVSCQLGHCTAADFRTHKFSHWILKGHLLDLLFQLVAAQLLSGEGGPSRAA